MKVDKFVFGVTCLGMAYLCNSAIHRQDNVEPMLQQRVVNNSPKLRPELFKDTVSFSNSSKDSISILKDSIKRIKK